MVRPIEITDSISKAEAIQRLQQTQKIQPEAANQFQKTLTDKMDHEQVKTPNPVPKEDQVVIHVDEKEEERNHKGDDRDESHEERHAAGHEQADENMKKRSGDGGRDHIDIRV